LIATGIKYLKALGHNQTYLATKPFRLMTDEILKNKFLLRQTTLDNFLQASELDEGDSLLLSLIAEDEPATKAINVWTRVFERQASNDRSNQVYDLGPDLILDQSLRDTLS
jgi:hypothetical protein